MLFHTQKLGYFTKNVDLNFLLKNQIIWQQRPRACVCVCVCMISCVDLFETPRTVSRLLCP